MRHLDKHSGFKTPAGYFEKLSGRIMDNIAQDPSTVSQEEGFKVPENYFHNLHSEITQKLEKQDSKVIPIKSFKKYYYTATSIAAILLLFFGLTWNTTKTISYTDLANSDIDQYFENQELSFSTYDLAEILSLGELDYNDVLENSLAEESILEYLNTNVKDLNELNLTNDE
ncbi:hypothetical protein SAMN04487911_10693 [Arenibacter nanhaiticus]|uniref:Uncharacterized protein n=1 Tax=Arenibacter nanhaiticus TaxID=558155 RepID=A0A1M6EBH6_9FLAO|nr:hypothetical protein [Arenibacter nanhaiticus]SHI82658.1 hypothetical protein SAMN04487911_10693 [Arenibacter nanhaiticus]